VLVQKRFARETRVSVATIQNVTCDADVMMGCGGREECVEGSRVWTHQKVVGTGVDVSPYEIEVTRDGEGTR
jgi:hypothetical protein